MRQNLAYLRYVLVHKWWVFVYGFRVGASPRLTLLHDLSKFDPEEWGPYAAHFYRPDGSKRPREEQADTKDAFDHAFVHHWTQNKHHPEYWHLFATGQPLPMPQRYVREMVADWMGAGRAINGKEDARGWYLANQERLAPKLHPQTRALVENLLHV